MRPTTNATLALQRLAEGLPEGWGARKVGRGSWEIQTEGKWWHHARPAKEALASLARCAMGGLGFPATHIRALINWRVLVMEKNGMKLLHSSDGIAAHDEYTLIQIGE